jgi:hypothetical protein
VLTPPDVSELQFHMRQSQAFTSQEALYAEDSLQRATDLMEMATGIHEDPEDELAYRVMQNGIMSMGHAIYAVSGEDAEALYSPFQSERLGSYSYSKMQQAVQDRGVTGVPAFDQAVKYFQGLDQAAGGDTSPFGVTAEQVWKQPYTEHEEGEKLRDPQVPLSEGAWSQ